VNISIEMSTICQPETFRLMKSLLNKNHSN
jgi:hypothetical protein